MPSGSVMTPPATKRLTERFAFSGGRVRRPGVDGHTKPYPVIEGVLLCGATSANRRRYKASAFGGAGERRYENKPVFLDHTDSHGRKYRDHIGWVEEGSERRDAHGRPVGDVGIKPTHAEAESVLWDAEHRPQNCGMSHVADCKTTRAADGWDDVESVESVESVDVVMGPATTKSFYEQANRGPTVPQTTLRAVIESVRPRLSAERSKAARKLLLLAEDDASMAPMMDAPVDEPVADAEPDDALWGGFWDAITQVGEKYKAGEMTRQEAGKKIVAYLKAHDGLTNDAPAAKGDDDAEPPAEEGRKPAVDYPGLLKECRLAAFTPTDLDLVALGAMTADQRREYVGDRKRATESRGAEPPRSTGREPAKPAAVKESKGNEAKADDATNYAWQD